MTIESLGCIVKVLLSFIYYFFVLFLLDCYKIDVISGRQLFFQVATDFQVKTFTYNSSYYGEIVICSDSYNCQYLSYPFERSNSSHILKPEWFTKSTLGISLKNLYVLVIDVKYSTIDKNDRKSYILVTTINKNILLNTSFYELLDNVSESGNYSKQLMPVDTVLSSCSFPNQLLVLRINCPSYYTFDINIYYGKNDQSRLFASLVAHWGLYEVSYCAPQGFYTSYMSRMPLNVNVMLSLRGIPISIHTVYPILERVYVFSTYVAIDSLTTWTISDTVPSNWFYQDLSSFYQHKEERSITLNQLPALNPDAITYYYNTTLQLPPDVKSIVFSVIYIGGIIVYYNGIQVARFFLPEIVNSTTYGESPTSRKDYFTIPILDTSSIAVIHMEVHSSILNRNHSCSIFALPFFSDEIRGYHSLILQAKDIVIENPYFALQEQGNIFVFTADYINPSIFIHFLNRVSINVNDVAMKMMPATEKPTTGIKYNTTAATYSLPSGSSFNTSYTFSIDFTPNTYRIYQLDFIYRPLNTTLCHLPNTTGLLEDGGFIPSTCPAGHYGYSLHECHDNSISQVITKNCWFYPPGLISYNTTLLTFYVQMYGESPIPFKPDTVESFVSATNLPNGLVLNKETGVISGTPTEVSVATIFSIGGRNPDFPFAAVIDIQIEIRSWNCSTEKNSFRYGTTVIEVESWKGCLKGTVEKYCTYENNSKVILIKNQSCDISLSFIIQIVLWVLVGAICLIGLCIVLRKGYKFILEKKEKKEKEKNAYDRSWRIEIPTIHRK